MTETENAAYVMTPLQQGWALPLKKTRNPFTENVKNSLDEKFMEGERTKKKFDPKKIAEMMERETVQQEGRATVPRFLPSELKNYREIASYFSRKTARMRAIAGCMEQSGKPDCPDGSPDNTEEGDNELEFMTDPLFPDHEEELLDQIQQHDEQQAASNL